MPISSFQSEVLRLLAAQRGPDSYIAGGIAINRDGSRSGKHEAIVQKDGEQMQLEWVTDSAFRFSPAQRDEPFGFVLHPVDLATNKAAAAADRRVPPSDAVGVVFMDGDKPVQPDPSALDRYRRNADAPSGVWPSSPALTHAMLDRYRKP